MRATSSSKAAKNISTETATVVGMLEALPSAKRKYLIEKLRELVSEEVAEQKWDSLLQSKPEPLLKMATKALKEHHDGKSKPMSL